MEKKERVLAALENKAADRPPVGFWFHFPEEKALGQACIDAHLDYYNQIDTDIAKLMCDGYFDYPNPVAKAVKEPEDWFRMQPLGKDHPFIREQVERAKAVRRGLKRPGLVLYNVFAPFSSIRFATSDELVMDHLQRNPEAIRHALDVIARDNALLSELLIREAGMDGIYYCVQGGEKGRFSVEEYRRMITPSDLYVLRHTNGFSDCNMLHCCGWAGIPNHMEVWQDYPAKAINWACFVEDMDLTQGKAFFGGKCVLGGFDNRPGGVLYSGTREDIMAYTRQLMQQCTEPGMMLGADCTLPRGIDIQRIQWVLDAVNEK